MSEFGNVLKNIRADLGLSQAALAGQIGSTQRHVSFVETGRSRVTQYFVELICGAIPLSIAQRQSLYETAGLKSPYAALCACDLKVPQWCKVKYQLIFGQAGFNTRRPCRRVRN